MSRIGQALARAASLENRRSAAAGAPGEPPARWPGPRQPDAGALTQYGPEDAPVEAAAPAEARPERPMRREETAASAPAHRRTPARTSEAWDEQLRSDLERLKRRIDTAGGSPDR